MIGVIVTGHNGFAHGMLEAARLLTGDAPNMAAVDFYVQESEDALKQHLQDALEKMKGCSEVFVLCDILGGSPFKNAAFLWYTREDIRIIYGANLPMLIELSMNLIMEQKDSDLAAMAENLITIGQQQIGQLK